MGEPNGVAPRSYAYALNPFQEFTMKHPFRLLAALLLGMLIADSSARAKDWPQWQGPNRNGSNAETGLLKSWPEGGPPRVWMFENCGAGYAGFSVVDGKLFTMGARDDTCQLIALDANTGEELWHVDLGPMLKNDWGNGPRSTPTVDHGLVYALGGKGTLACVRATDGHEIWRTNLEDDLAGTEPKWGYAESVLVDGDQVVCTPGGKEGAIAALDKATGKVRWRATELDDTAHYSSVVPAKINGQPQYVQLLETRLVGVSPADGHVLWQQDFPGHAAVIPTPIVVGNQVFATAGYGAGCTLVEIGPDNTVTEKYDDRTRKRMKNHHGGVIHLGDNLYGYSDDVGWLCMDFATGEQKWREREALSKGAISYADGMFYCLGEDDGEVVLIDASPDGWQEHGRFKLDPQTKIRSDRGKIWTHPVISGGKLYLRDQDLVYCYDVNAK
jgi:outer membrane protein assembly factor BamB